MATKHKKTRKGPVTSAMRFSGKLVDGAAESADRLIGKVVGFNPESDYPERPHGETEAGFMNRMAGRKAHQMRIDDWMRFTAYEYLAGGDRRQRLIDAGLGTEEARRAYHAKALKEHSTKENPTSDRYLLFSQSMHTQPPNEHGTVSGSLTYVPHGTKIEVIRKGSPHRFLVHGHFGPIEFWGWANESDIATARAYKQVHGDDPEGMKRNPTGNPKSPSEMSAGEINKALDKLDALSSKLTDEFIAAGRGHERPSEIFKMDDPLARRFKELYAKRVPLRNEIERRYGPGAPSRLPRGAGPIKKFNGRRNPSSDAAAMYESFHGRPSSSIDEFEEPEHYHANLAGLGTMIGLKIRTVTGYDMTVEFNGDVMLCSNEEGTQLYLVGGDQAIDLKKVKLDDVKKDSLVVGEAWLIGYQTEKDFDNFEKIDYIHGFGEEKDHPKLPKGADLWEDSEAPKDESFGLGVYPTVRYDCLNERLFLDGGQYKIDRPLIGTSPGIEG